MNYQTIYTVCNSESKHIIGLTTECALDLIKYVDIDIYGIPLELDEMIAEAALDDKSIAVYIGKITGSLILAYEMAERGEDMYTLCDDDNADLEYVVSALMENGGPLSEIINHLYINEVELNDKSLFNVISENLNNIIFSHFQIHPEIISYYPMPLPHEQSLADKVKQDMAVIAYTEMLNRKESNEECDNPQIVISHEQINMIIGRRNVGESYPSKYINHDVWDMYIKAGFREWKNTRVLYYIY